MKKTALTLILTTVTVLTGISQVMTSSSQVSAGDVRGWISFLASDQMRGRANGSSEMVTAANWIMEKFHENGLTPAPGSETYLQEFTTVSRQKTLNQMNVIGMLPGSDPVLKDQYIVISAHFDHIGIRKGVQGDSICNGADDNASGVSALIGIAQNFKKSGLKPGRSLIFVAFSGEEIGFRGSRYFVANPPVPVRNMYADINFEMIGHSGLLGKNRYYMTGCGLSELDRIIQEFDKKSGFQLVDTIPAASGLFYSSDNISFSVLSKNENPMTGIPSGTFATSTMESYLHTPQDEASLFDFENMTGLINHFSEVIYYLSDYKGNIAWIDKRFKRPE